MRSTFVLFLFSIVLAFGCDGAELRADGSAPLRDAALSDAGGLLDGHDGSALDAAVRSDAGSLSRCGGGLCDPRFPGGMSCEQGACLLRGQAPTCEAEAGFTLPGQACTEVGQCSDGMACFQTSEGGVCARVCCPDDGSACGAEEQCAGSGTLIDGTPTGFGRCGPARDCDPLSLEASCEIGEGCYIAVEDGATLTQCQIAGDYGAGAFCALQRDCQPGFFCGGLIARRCLRICELGTENCPRGEGNCIAQAHSPEGTGFCTLDVTTARSR